MYVKNCRNPAEIMNLEIEINNQSLSPSTIRCYQNSYYALTSYFERRYHQRLNELYRPKGLKIILVSLFFYPLAFVNTFECTFYVVQV